MSTQATAIRDAIAEIIAGLGYYKVIRKSPQPQLQSTDLPAASVFTLSERMTDPDWNMGEPSFQGDTVISVSVFYGFDTPDVLDGLIDQDADLLERAILGNPDFMRLGPTALHEGVSDIQRRFRRPQQGETYLAEVSMEMTFKTQPTFPPVIPDDFKKLVLIARQAGKDENTPTVTVEIDFP